MTHYSVRPMGSYFAVHADDSGYNVIGYTKEEMARSKVDRLNYRDTLRSRIQTNVARQRGKVLPEDTLDVIVDAVTSCSIPLVGRYVCTNHSGPVPCDNCVRQDS